MYDGMGSFKEKTPVNRMKYRIGYGQGERSLDTPSEVE